MTLTLDQKRRLVQGFGRIHDRSAVTWPVDRLIHSGITCVTGQPEKGKTTLLFTLCAALLGGHDQWLDRPVNYNPDRPILFGCEDAGSQIHLEDYGLGDNLVAFTVEGLPESASEMVQEWTNQKPGLIILDSVYGLVSNVNEQAEAGRLLSVLRRAPCPVIVVHHEAKSGGGRPAGAQPYAAAYRHTLKLDKSKPAGTDELDARVQVSGNNVPGVETFWARLNRSTLAARTTSNNTATTTRGSRTSDGPGPPDKLDALAALAKRQGSLPPRTASHNDWARWFVGGSQGHEDWEKAMEVMRAAWPELEQRGRTEPIKFKTVAKALAPPNIKHFLELVYG